MRRNTPFTTSRVLTATYRLGEYEGLENAREVACFIAEYPAFGGDLLAHFSDLEQARKAA